MRGWTFLKLALFSLWLGALSWLIRREAFPHLFEDGAAGYRTMMRELPAVRDQWMKVLADGQHVGYANSSLELEEVDQQEELVLRSQFVILLRMPNGPEQIRFTSRVNIRSDQTLRGFDAKVQFQTLEGTVQGLRAERDQFDVTLSLGTLGMQRRVTIPDHAVISGPFGEFGMAPLRPGQEMRMRTFDLFSLSGESSDVFLRGEAIETLRTGLGEQETFRILVSSGEISFRVWINEFGQVIRQETPFGLTLEAATVQDAIRIPREAALDPLSLQLQPSFLNLPGL